jgi:hypothetical protein
MIGEVTCAATAGPVTTIMRAAIHPTASMANLTDVPDIGIPPVVAYHSICIREISAKLDEKQIQRIQATILRVRNWIETVGILSGSHGLCG